MYAIENPLKSGGAVSAVAPGLCFSALSVGVAPSMPVAETAAARFMNRRFVTCVLVAFSLFASHTSAFAEVRACTGSEVRYLTTANIINCSNAGGEILCTSFGAPRCCPSDATEAFQCDQLVNRVTIPPPGSRPPAVKVDVPIIRDVSPPPKTPRLPRIDIPPSGVAPVKPPAGPIVR